MVGWVLPTGWVPDTEQGMWGEGMPSPGAHKGGSGGGNATRARTTGRRRGRGGKGGGSGSALPPLRVPDQRWDELGRVQKPGTLLPGTHRSGGHVLHEDGGQLVEQLLRLPHLRAAGRWCVHVDANTAGRRDKGEGKEEKRGGVGWREMGGGAMW